MLPQGEEKRQGRHVILVVDDDPVVTQSLSAFLELETDHEIVTTESARRALEIARARRIDVVITDFLMPEMTGLQLLSEMKNIHPDVPRIMLTGYADKENSIRAINEVGLFQYLEKPWDNDQLKLVIDSALTNKSLRENLRERIKELDAILLERDRLAARDERLRDELTLARKLQESMLPNGFPTEDLEFCAAFLPALDVGGDFYDAIPLAGGRCGILVADATGHGIQAALSTAILKFAFTKFTNCDAGVSEILLGMNGVLTRGLPEDTYVAALVAVVDPSTGGCSMLNAGLPHPFVIRRRQGIVERIGVNGFMLGMVDDAEYTHDEPVSIGLDSGDSLHLFTDGLCEAEDESGNQFDDERLGAVLSDMVDRPLVDIHRELLVAGRAFSHPNHQWDDITLVGIGKP